MFNITFRIKPTMCDCCELDKETYTAKTVIRFDSGDIWNICDDCLKQLHSGLNNKFNQPVPKTS